jgi:ubiquinone/menaquinone biosynthesis C-methylase UbiE
MNRQPAASESGWDSGNWCGLHPYRALNVADVGCGAGARARLWAAHGHQVYGADSDAALVALARGRTAAAGLEIMFDHADANALPWPDRSMDVCIASGVQARTAGAELMRVLRPGGVLHIRSANALSPVLDWFTFHCLRRRRARLARCWR